MGSLSGRVAFITGAARGQGRAHAVKLASEGADIIAVDLCDQIASVPYPLATSDDLAATVKLVEDTGARIVALQADVRDRDAARRPPSRPASTNSAAGWTSSSPMRASPRWRASDAWQDVIDVNLTGVYHTVDVAMRPMIKAGNGGAIVLTSSVAGLVGLASPHGRLHRLRGRQARHRRPDAGLREPPCAAQHPGQLGPSGRREHADDRQRVHPAVARRSRRGEPDGPDMGNALPVRDAGARRHRQRRALVGFRRGPLRHRRHAAGRRRVTSTSAEVSRNPATRTAFGPIVLSAIEQHEPPDRRLVDDDLAASFLPDRCKRWFARRGSSRCAEWSSRHPNDPVPGCGRIWPAARATSTTTSRSRCPTSRPW